MIAANFASSQQGNPMKILHLEDSLADHRLTCKSLESEGIDFSIVRVETLAEFSNQTQTNPPDLVLADYHLAGFNAIDAWQTVPKDHTAPFILLSGAIGEAAAVEAIKMGISDYLHKDELSKIGRVVRRSMETALARKEKRAAEDELRISKQRLAQFTRHLQATIESERASIAREIHDDIGGSLAAVRLDLAWISRNCSDSEVLLHTETAGSMVQQALEASQRIMHNLRPSILDQGLVPAVQWLAYGFERRSGIPTTLTFDQSHTDLPACVQLAAFRAVQEALTNIAKHADCTAVKLDISDSDEVLTVEITDNGQGFSEADRLKATSFGLRGLIERADSVGGWLDIGTQPGRGTSIVMTVPLNNPTSSDYGQSQN